MRLREGRSTKIYELKCRVDTEEAHQLGRKTTEMGATDDKEAPEVIHVLVTNI